MSEVGRLEGLEARLGLLRRSGTEQQLLENAAAFTRAAAWELREEGWANVRKTSGSHVQNLDVDKILNRHTLEMVDIVVGAGALGQHVAWQPAGTGVPSQVVDPANPDGEPPIDVPTPQPVLEYLEDIRDLVDNIDDKLQATLEHAREQSSDLAIVRGILERAATKFGV
jgi:hypothetical protein